MALFKELMNFLVGGPQPPQEVQRPGRPDYEDNVGGPMAQNLRVSRIGQRDTSPSRTRPAAPTSGGTLYDRRRAENIINQLTSQGVAPESAVAIAAAHMETARGGATVYSPNSRGVFANYQMRFDSPDGLRAYAARIGADVDDLSSLLSYSQNEAAIAEMAGYEFTSGRPGPASQALSGIHSEFGQFLMNRPNDRTARIADQMMMDFFGNQEDSAPAETDPAPVGDIGSPSAAPAPDAVGAAPPPVQEPQMQPGMRPQPRPGEAVSGGQPAPQPQEPPMVERPGEQTAFTRPITVLDDNGNAMSFNSLSRPEQRQYLLNNPQGAVAVTDQAAPPVADDVDLSATRITGEPRGTSDVTVAGGVSTGADRRAQGFLDRMFNQGTDADAELARVRRRNFFRVFAESLNYLTTGSANLGPVYAAADRAEAEAMERIDAEQQQRVLAEMATNMGMGELVGLMALGDEGVSAVRRAVIGAAVGRVSGSGSGGSGGGSSEDEEAAVNPADFGQIEFFNNATGGSPEDIEPIRAAVSDNAPSLAPPAAANFEGGYQSSDSMVDFASFTPPAQSAPVGAEAPVTLASASAKDEPAPERTYLQSPAAAPVPSAPSDMGAPALGFDPSFVGRQYDETTLPGQRPDRAVPQDRYNYAIDTLAGTPQETEARSIVSQIAQERMRSDPDEVGLRQLEQDLNQLLTDGQQWRLGEEATNLERSREEADEAAARANRQATVDAALQTVFYDDDRERLRAMGIGAADDPELMDEFMAAYQDVERAPADVQLRNTFAAINERHAAYMENQGRYVSARNAAREQAIALADPEADPNALQANIIAPIRDYLEPVLGSEFFEGIQNDSTRFAIRAVNGIADQALSFVAADVQGNLSNLEGQKLTALFAQSTDNRIRGLGMTQYVRANVSRIEAIQEASFNYINSLETQSDFDYEEYNRLLQEAGDSVQAFPEITQAEFDALVRDAARRSSMGIEVPREELGMVYAIRVPTGPDGQFRIQYTTLYDYGD